MLELVIGDDFPFTAREVTWERDDSLVPDADLSWSLKNESNIELAAGALASYDSATASFEGVVPRTATALYDSSSNPLGLKPGRKYFIDVGMENDGVLSTVSIEVTAVLRRSR